MTPTTFLLLSPTPRILPGSFSGFLTAWARSLHSTGRFTSSRLDFFLLKSKIRWFAPATGYSYKRFTRGIFFGSKFGNFPSSGLPRCDKRGEIWIPFFGQVVALYRPVRRSPLREHFPGWLCIATKSLELDVRTLLTKIK